MCVFYTCGITTGIHTCTQPPRNSRGIPQVSTRFSMKMSRLTRDGTAEPVSRDQILRRERGQGNIRFSCSADHERDWQPYPVDPYSRYMCDHTYIHIHHARYIYCSNNHIDISVNTVSLDLWRICTEFMVLSLPADIYIFMVLPWT